MDTSRNAEAVSFDILNDVCVACLTSGQDRMTCPIKDPAFFSEITSIKLSSLSMDMVCWECNAMLMKIKRFRAKALKANTILSNKSKQITPYESLSTLKLNNLNNWLSIDSTSQMLIDQSIVKKEPNSEQELNIVETRERLDFVGNSLFSEKIEIEVDITDYTNQKILDKPVEQTGTKLFKNSPQLTLPKMPSSFEILMTTPMESELDSTVNNTYKERLTEQEMREFRAERLKNAKNSLWVHFCEKCLEKFMNQQEFEAHLKNHDRSAGPFSCNICELRFQTEEILLEHRESHYRLALSLKIEEQTEHVQPSKKRRVHSPNLPTTASTSSTDFHATIKIEPFSPECEDDPSVSSDTESSRNPLNESQIEALLKCAGSDFESDDDDDDDVTIRLSIPRTAYTYMDTPIDNTPLLQESNADSHLCDFKWISCPTRKESRSEPFKSSNLGPTIPHKTPIDIFKHIWDESVMDLIANETNRYAGQMAVKMDKEDKLGPHSRIRNWRDTTKQELYVFFGVTLAMGMLVKSRLKEYWNTYDDIFNTPGFRIHMTLQRYILLNSCLHFTDNLQMPSDLDGAEARILKIKPIMTHLNEKFKNMYNMRRNIALDQSLLKWRVEEQTRKSRKSSRLGINSHEVYEPQTGYLWRFLINSQSAESTSSPSFVVKLLRGLENKGHAVFMDDFYSSPLLARKLKCLGFDCAGLLRTNRQYVPAEIENLQRIRMEKGHIIAVTSGDVDLLVWRDRGQVAMISTYHGKATDTDGTIKPVLARDYSVIMADLDKKDKLMSSLPIGRIRTAWYKKLFRRLLNASVLNAYIVYKSQNNGIKTLYSFRDFRKDLVLSLVSHGNFTDAIVEPNCDVLQHYLKEFPYAPKKGRQRRKCNVCRRRTTTFCAGCDKATCMGCFPQLHVQ